VRQSKAGICTRLLLRNAHSHQSPPGFLWQICFLPSSVNTELTFAGFNGFSRGSVRKRYMQRTSVCLTYTSMPRTRRARVPRSSWQMHLMAWAQPGREPERSGVMRRGVLPGRSSLRLPGRPRGRFWECKDARRCGRLRGSLTQELWVFRRGSALGYEQCLF